MSYWVLQKANTSNIIKVLECTNLILYTGRENKKEETKNAFQQKLMLSKAQISEFIDYFIDLLPVFLKGKLSL